MLKTTQRKKKTIRIFLEFFLFLG